MFQINKKRVQTLQADESINGDDGDAPIFFDGDGARNLLLTVAWHALNFKHTITSVTLTVFD